MKHWWKYLIVVILGSVACYHIAIQMTPNVIYAGAKKKIYDRNGVGINEIAVSPVITADMRSVVMPNPDFLYLTAFYDLSEGPLRLHGEMPDSTYWSVSMYHPNTVNWYVKNDIQFKEGNLIKADWQGSDDLDIAFFHGPGSISYANNQMIPCAKKEGFLLIRVLITDRTEERVKEFQELLGKVKLEKI